MGRNQWKFIWWVGEGRGMNASDGKRAEVKGLRQKRAGSQDAGLSEAERPCQKAVRGNLERYRALKAGGQEWT